MPVTLSLTATVNSVDVTTQECVDRPYWDRISEARLSAAGVALGQRLFAAGVYEGLGRLLPLLLAGADRSEREAPKAPPSPRGYKSWPAGSPSSRTGPRTPASTPWPTDGMRWPAEIRWQERGYSREGAWSFPVNPGTPAL